MTTAYLVKPENSTTWHHVKPCVSLSRKNAQGKLEPILHWSNMEGVIICSAYDEHELIVVGVHGEKVDTFTISPREYFQDMFDREELEAASA